MTPMVDLAFLLLTFFILTTTLSGLRVMELAMPEPMKDPDKAPRLEAKNAFNLVLAEDNTLYWWIGLEGPAQPSNFSKDGIRQVLLKEQQANPEIMVLIKAKDHAKYENMVDILDEVRIANIQRYAIVEYTRDDESILTGNRE